MKKLSSLILLTLLISTQYISILSLKNSTFINVNATSRVNITSIINKTALNFYFLGDWGKGGIDGDITAVSSRKLQEDHERNHDHAHEHQQKNEYTYQNAIGKAMIVYSKTTKPKCIIALGDNFYSDGVASTSDSLWTSNWKNIYLPNNDSNSLAVPWYPIFGNHDYGYGN
jgi:hypothetical protein